MKIAIASDDQAFTSYRFERAKGMMIYEMTEEELKFQSYVPVEEIEYPQEKPEHIAALSKTSTILSTLKGCKYVIVHCIEKDMLKLLTETGFTVIQYQESEIEKVLNLFVKDMQIKTF